MPKEKYKIHDVAKDFGLASKDIIAILSKYSAEEKKHSTALDDNELNIVFDTLTQENSVSSFDEYFAAAEREKERKQQEAEQKAAEDEAAPQEAAPEQETAPAKEAAPAPEKKEEQVKPEEKKADGKPEKKTDINPEKKAEKAAATEEKKPEKAKTAPAQEKAKAAPAAKQQTQPVKNEQPKKKEKKDVAQSRVRGEERRIDTRSSNVDLEKYNERYEEIAPSSKYENNGSSKQKIKQKSQQYRKQGMRSSKHETDNERLKRLEAERAKKTLVITVGEEITVGELAAKLKRTSSEVIKKLFAFGVMATVNEVIDFDTAEIVATELGAKVEKEVVVTIEDRIIDDHEDLDTELLPRDPVIVVMGHVDHGKTSILDAIRNTAVTETEAGGITQHIGAYRVEINGKKITFLDTPGHAAFTAMRARGAMATDIAVLVVAADDGIMPQTIEAINHAKAANVQIIVAINKMDKDTANPDRIMQQLTEYSLVPEEWGGETICVPVSAKTRMGIDNLLESILLVAEVAELKANPNRAAKGVVIEARLDKAKGPIATLLVQNGTLNAGDIIVAGTSVGRVRVMTNDRGQKVKSAGPSVPVEIMGLSETPNAGDSFDAVSDEKLAKQLVEDRKFKLKEEQLGGSPSVTLDNLFSSIREGEVKELNVIVKADVQGSVEAVKQNLEKLSNDEVRVKVIHGSVGAVSESDVMLAHASNAIIVGFNVRPDPVAKSNAERDGVEMRMYRVIYDCMEEIEAAMKGMLAPKTRDVDLGRAEIRSVMNLSSAGKIAGCYVLEGKIARNAKIRVVRDGIVVFEDEIASLRRFKDDVKEVLTGFECGVGLAKFNDFKEGDVFEAFLTEEYRD